MPGPRVTPELPQHLRELRDLGEDTSAAESMRDKWLIEFAKPNRPQARGRVRCRFDGALIGEVLDVDQVAVLGIENPVGRLHVVIAPVVGHDLAVVAGHGGVVDGHNPARFRVWLLTR